MNKKNISIVVFILLIGVDIWYFWSSPHSIVKEQVETTQTEKPIAQKEEKPVLVSEVLAEPSKFPKKFEQVKRVKRFQDAMSSGFEYYGKVIDQHGEPVVGAEITARWAYFPFIPNGDFGPNYKNLHYTTDSDGRFEIKKSKGMSLTIKYIEKDGYEIKSNTAYMFSAGGYKMLQSFSNPDKPVIFHAWKKTEAEGLVYSDGFFGFYDSGQPYTIDIQRELKHKGIVGGDLTIVMHRSASGSRHEPSDWSVDIRAIDGGLIETTDVFMNEAPESGYVNSWSISRKKGEQNFSSELTRKFYLKSRGGVYSKLHVRFLPYYKDEVGVVEVLAWVNPNGSRNLQYDPAKRIYLK